MSDTELEHLQKAIQVLEAQRPALGDAIVDAALAPLLARHSALQTRSAELQRRYVTLLFADVSGYTALSETLDAEEVNLLMNTLWQRLDHAIMRHGGRIDRHMGDGVIATWSADVTHENDPEQAVLAALEMQREASAIAIPGARRAESGTAGPVPARLGLRIGIHSGQVLIGEVGARGERTAVGESVVIAESLEKHAPVGGILISYDTYRLVHFRMEADPYGVLEEVGLSEARETYLVRGMLGREGERRVYGLAGVNTPLVGRDQELAALQNALAETVAQRRLMMVVVSGPIGIGKTRLLEEFGRLVQAQPGAVNIVKARAAPEMQNQPAALLRELVAYQFRIVDSDPPETAREKIERGVSAVLEPAVAQTALLDSGLPAGMVPFYLASRIQTQALLQPQTQVQMKAHFIGQLAGFDFSASPHLKGILADARQFHDRALNYLGEYLAALADQKPLLLLLDDLHLADDRSLDLLERLPRDLADVPILLVGTGRAALFERRAGWKMETESWRRLTLQALSPAESRRLVGAILARVAELPSKLLDLIVENAEGNPYYAEALIEMLMEDQVIQVGEPNWRVDARRLTGLRVPPTLTGVLQARLDSLDAAERQVLQCASVIGRTFWDQAVGSVCSPEPGGLRVFTAVLDRLAQRELILLHEPPAFAGTREYTFKHLLLHEVTFDSVLKRDRRVYHARTAAWLEAAARERASEYAGVIAEHWELAGQAPQAAAAFLEAGLQAARRFANKEALAYLDRALALVPGDDLARQFAIYAGREQVLEILGRRDEQSQDLDQLEELAQALGDLPLRTEAALRRASHALLTSNYLVALDASNRAVALARQAADAGYEAQANFVLGRTQSALGDSALARRYLQRAVELAHMASETAGTARLSVAALRTLEANSVRWLGVVTAEAGDYVGSMPFFELALHLHRESGDRRGEGSALNNLALIANSLGDFERARRFHEQSLVIRRETGDRRGEAVTYNNLGLVCSDQADYVGARQYLEQALQIYGEVGDRDGEDGALLNLGLVSLAIGDFPSARQSMEQALLVAREIGDRDGEALALTDLGLLFHLTGDQEKSIQMVQQALQLAQELDDARTQSFAWNHLAHAAAARGDLEQAYQAYWRALELRRELELERLAMEPLAGLVQVALRRGDQDQARNYTLEILDFILAKDASTRPVLLPGALDGTLEPFRVFLAVIAGLQAIGDERWRVILQDVIALLRQRAGRLPDAQARRSYLENIPSHHELIRLSG